MNTKGPWDYKIEADGSFILAPRVSAKAGLILAADTYAKPTHSDAALIAAAPELLEMLQYWFRYSQDVDSSCLTKGLREELKEMTAYTREVIKKAQG